MAAMMCAAAGILASGGGGGSSASGSISGAVNSTAMVAVSDELEIYSGIDGQVALTASYSFTPGSQAQLHIDTRWYELIGSTWTAIGVVVQSTSPSYWEIYGNPPMGVNEFHGSGACNFTRTGLTANTSRKFKLYARGPGSVAMSLSGSIAGTGS